MKKRKLSAHVPQRIRQVQKFRPEFPPEGSMQPKQQQVQEVKQEDPPEPHVPQEKADNLFSRNYARVVDVISEGPVEGPCYPNGKTIGNGAHLGMAIYFDEVPILGTDGRKNIDGVTYGWLRGTQDQFAIPGFGQAMELLQGGQIMKYNKPVVTAITNPDAVSVEVAVRVHSLSFQDKEKGDIYGYEVRWKVEVSLNGGGYALLENLLLKGKCSQPYIWGRAYRLPRTAPDSTTDSWNIRLTRLSKDDDTAYAQSDTSFEFINVVTRGSFSYPNSALFALEVDAEGYQSVPVRGYHMKLLRVLVPSNYFPLTREYNRNFLDGSAIEVEDTDPESETFGELIPAEQPWNGSFYLAWTDNPAWCFYDLLTNTRYGLGQYITSSGVDKWELYNIGKYCDELVEDGFGGEEPRFTCNTYIQAQEEAYKVIQDFSSVFRGISYYANGVIFPVQDRPKDVWTQFSNANVENGMFTYSGTAKKARHTVAVVRYVDPEEQFKTKYEYVEDISGILEYGHRETQVTAFACSSRGQARRLGRWTLLSELNETETVTFRTGTEAVGLRPGHIIRVLDTFRSGTKQGGRIIAISEDRQTVEVDREVKLIPGVVSFHVVTPNVMLHPSQVTVSGTELQPSHVTDYVVSNNPADGERRTNMIELTAPLSEDVALGAVWVVQTPDVVAQDFRILNVQEIEKGKFEVTGLEFLMAKFDATEHDIELEDPDISELPTNPGKPAAVTDLEITRAAVNDSAGPQLKLLISWESPDDEIADGHKVEWRRGNDPWALLTTTSRNYAELVYQLPGVYEIAVTVIGRFGVNSDKVVASYTVSNTSPIELYSVTGLELVGADSEGQGNDTNFIGQDAKFQWRLNSPLSGAPIGSEVAGIGVDGEDPYFQDFEVTVWDVASDQRVYTEITKDPHFEFTREKNRESVGAPQPTGRSQFRIEVRGRDKWGDKTDPAKLTVQNPAPLPPTGLQAFAAFAAVWLKWTNTLDIDFDYNEVYEGTTNVFGDAVLIATTKAQQLFRGTVPAGETRFYWVKSVDTFGTKSALSEPQSGVSCTTATVVATDIGEFAVDATKIFTKTVILQGDEWQHNDPIAGSISWNEHTLVNNGVKYTIAAGDTTMPYIVWRNGATTYETLPVHPNDNVLTQIEDGDFMIATNVSGHFDLAWNRMANAVIGSAYIVNAAIKNAHIANVSADKIQAGTIDSQEIILDGVGGVIRSANYDPGVDGWIIRADGSAEFNNLIVRESLSHEIYYENEDYPGRFFTDRPRILWNSYDGISFGGDYDADVGGVAPEEGYIALPIRHPGTLSDDFRAPVRYSDGTNLGAAHPFTAVRYAHRPFWMTLGGPGISFRDPIFIGTNVVSEICSTGHPTVGEWNLGEEYAPGVNFHRIGRTDYARFEFRIVAQVLEMLGVYFITVPAPDPGSGLFLRDLYTTSQAAVVASGGTKTLLGSATLPWNQLKVRKSLTGTASRRTIELFHSRHIQVPEDHVILFAIGSVDWSDGIGDDIITELSWDVQVQNVGISQIWTGYPLLPP